LIINFLDSNNFGNLSFEDSTKTRSKMRYAHKI